MEKKMTIPFSPPDITEAEINEVIAALRSGWITTGPRTKLFEQKIAESCTTRRAICLNSATASLELALRLLGIGEGDEVIVPAYTYTATASVVCHVGAKPVIVDSQPDHFEMDYDRLADAITSRTKAVIPVELGGVPCDHRRISDAVESKRALFAPKNDLQRAIGHVAVVSDAAHAFGACRDGLPVGAIADFTAFSFHAVKNLTTAEGGALTWREIDGIDSDDLYRRLQIFSLHGQTKDALTKETSGSWEYDVLYPGYKCNMTDICAALGLSQLERYESILAYRKKIIERYNAALHPLGVRTLRHDVPNGRSSGHLYLTRIDGLTPDRRNVFIDRLAQRGVITNVHYKPLPMLTAYRNMGFDIADYPNAYALFANEVTLPLHTRLSEEEIEYVISQYIEELKCL